VNAIGKIEHVDSILEEKRCLLRAPYIVESPGKMADEGENDVGDVGTH
jgi:hypothetical protein